MVVSEQEIDGGQQGGREGEREGGREGKWRSTHENNYASLREGSCRRGIIGHRIVSVDRLWGRRPWKLRRTPSSSDTSYTPHPLLGDDAGAGAPPEQFGEGGARTRGRGRTRTTKKRDGGDNNTRPIPVFPLLLPPKPSRFPP